MGTSRVKIHWKDADDDLENRVRVLYAYVHPRRDEVLYIGKADRATARERLHAPDKRRFWSDLEKHRGLFQHGFIVGVPELPPSSRLTGQLLHDLEALLISHHQPWGNIQSIRSRSISRPGLVVENAGRAWCGDRLIVD